MSKELRHADAGVQLTRTEDNALDRHYLVSGANNDILVYDSANAKLVGKTPTEIRAILGLGLGAKVYSDALQSIPDDTETAIAFNQEFYDTDTIHDNVTNNSRLTCKTAGKYLIIGVGFWAAHATGWRGVRIKKNGTRIAPISLPIVAAVAFGMETVCILDLAVNEYVELFGIQDSGGNLDYGHTAGNYSFFEMQRIG